MARLIYLLGASHSGSTLLAMVLGAQPGACTTGELKATSLGDPRTYRCSCKSTIGDCEFWRAISAEMAARGFPGFDITHAGTSIFEVRSAYARRLLSPLHRGPALELLRDVALGLSPAWWGHVREAAARNVALVESVLSTTNARLVIDSSKVALRLKYLLKHTDLDIKVVRVIRDGRAVAMTYMDEWSFADAADPALRGGGTGARRAPPRRTMVEAANEWKRSQEANEALLATLPPSQWTAVRYEDFCSDPLGTLRRLCKFVGLDATQATLDFRARSQHVIGNGMRFDTSAVIKLDERWKSHLSGEDLATFDHVAGALNRQYGYDEPATQRRATEHDILSSNA